MTFHFIAPGFHGVTDITVEADDLDAAFRYFEMKHWFGPGPSVGVWQSDVLVAHVFTGYEPDGKTPRAVCVPVPLRAGEKRGD